LVGNFQTLALKIGVINATFTLSGIISVENVRLKMCAKGLEISLDINFAMFVLIPSSLQLLFDFIFFSSNSSSFSVMDLRKKLIYNYL
jgi:hypothetical protein